MRRAGDNAILLELGDNAGVQAAARAARARCGDALIEVVPGHTTLLLVGRAGAVLDGLEEDWSSSPLRRCAAGRSGR